MAESIAEADPRPPLMRDRAFHGMTATQFLGAFNDNVFQQLLLLYYIGLGTAAATEADATTYQAVAGFVFAVPFVLFSGLAGYWSDRVVKREIVVASKVAEIVVMVCGLLAFLSGNVYAPFVVLFLMALQSTFFGPSKYGILPELLRDRDLPAANGLIQMTTFLAIIFGSVVAGVSKDLVETHLGGRLWLISFGCIGVAALGTWTSLWIRRTPVAHPNLKFQWSALALAPETRNFLRRNVRMRNVLLVVSLFWFIAGAVRYTVNEFGKVQLAIGDTGTSLLQACLAIGIAAGCMTAGKLSRHRIRFDFVTGGAFGIGTALTALTGLGSVQNADLLASTPAAYGAAALLFALGIATGFFVVPLQVVMQSRSPASLKGRIIAAMNLFNFVGILLSSVFYWGFGRLFKDVLGLPISAVFAAAAAVMLGIALAYRPRHDDTEDVNETGRVAGDGSAGTDASTLPMSRVS